MIKSMTGFSKAEVNENGIHATVELKCLNGRYLDINCKMPRNIQHREYEVRELLRRTVSRGTLTVNINVESSAATGNFSIKEDAARNIYNSLNNIRKKLKIKQNVSIEHLLKFSDEIIATTEGEDEELIMNVVKNAVTNSVRNLDNMQKKEGQQIMKDIMNRMRNVTELVEKVSKLGLEKIPAERERLRQRIAQLFESDEYDEQRLQTEMVLLADKLDISEEVVRLNSHFLFFYETVKSLEPSGRKINFLLQEMGREVNTIGNKANDAQISQLIVTVKEELERIREQIQNIE
ncbi:MAG: YicC family protein [Candidatus Kapabacteria bacterium]|nr:YicC family protein [Ignavibacteriota bacterium]MCW5885457.1 YicC family protein [Candidatus Kapabacteria bacterium]